MLLAQAVVLLPSEKAKRGKAISYLRSFSTAKILKMLNPQVSMNLDPR
jgi:hypothetical protein